VLEGSEKRKKYVCELGVVIGLLDESVGVLEEVESVGERKKEWGIGGESEERLERSSILVTNGVRKSIQILSDPSVSFPHAHARVRHCNLLVPSSSSSSSSCSCWLLSQSHSDRNSVFSLDQNRKKTPNFFCQEKKKKKTSEW
jgi:hypothetical protein